MKDLNPADEKVQKQVEILQSLGNAYGGGGSMSENIDKVGGAGTAEFAKSAVLEYCARVKD